MRHTGKYNQVGQVWEKLMQWAINNEYRINASIGISWDDPYITEEDHIRYDACIDIHQEFNSGKGIQKTEINGGKYIQGIIQGNYDKLSLGYDYIYCKYIPKNNLELRNEPCFEIYTNHGPKISPDQYITEIYIPIQ